MITLSAAAVQAEFEVSHSQVALVKFSSSGNKPPLSGIMERAMTLKDLIKEMRRQGVDIFPDYDSHCYIEGKGCDCWSFRQSFCDEHIPLALGLPLKDIQTERHLYYCMALTCNALNFSWSRWNLLSGFDKLLMQFREKVPDNPEGPQQVVLVTPEKTSVLECTEASQTFSEKPVAGFDNLFDLYTMALDKCSQPVQDQLPLAEAVFVDTVYRFLMASKVLSYA